MIVRRKVFISYHHDDQAYVDFFIKTFDDHHDTFIARQLGQMAYDIINSTNTDYVMQRIRADYIKDSTVTVVMMGKCTWARRYVDWEIQASLRSGETITPNGLLGIKLPTFSQFPERFLANLKREGQIDAYAGFIDNPRDAQTLWNAIEWANSRRTTHRKYIVNPRERFGYNKTCN